VTLYGRFQYFVLPERRLTAENLVANEQGSFTTPSFVSFTDDERLIGESAKNQAAMNPANTIFDIKYVPLHRSGLVTKAETSPRRLIGRRFDDPTVKKDIESWPFKVVDQGGNPMVQVEYLKETKVFSPQEISSMVLMKVCGSRKVSNDSCLQIVR